VHLIRFRATEGGTGEGVERDVAVDVPKFRFVGRDEFDHPWHLALWLPNDPDAPTVLINEDPPILSEAIRHHQEQYLESGCRKVRGAGAQQLAVDLLVESRCARYAASKLGFENICS
jgi:hypothetical protein